MAAAQKYTVLSDRIEGHARGDVVTEDDLPGVNIRALIRSKHLAPKAARSKGRSDG